MVRDGINAVAALVVLLGSIGAMALVHPTRTHHHAQPGRNSADMEVSLERVPLPGGGVGLVDASGRAVPLKRYTRVASLSMIANDVLLEVAEPERIVAFSRHGVDNARTPYRFSGKSTLTSLRDVEAVLALNPDLVLIHNLSGPGPAERLREAGIAVFDLGHMRGRATLVEDTLQIAALMGDPARGERVIRPWLRRMDRVASGVDRSKAPTALYVSLYAGRMFGGAAQTSYHDVLEAAGVVDAAAEHGFEGWPNYNAEQLVTINPDVIITPEGMAKRLCAQPGLDILQACVRGQVLEFNGSMLSDPGLGMLEASEAIHTRIYSEQKGDRQPQLDAPGVKEQPERPTEEASP